MPNFFFLMPTDKKCVPTALEKCQIVAIWHEKCQLGNPASFVRNNKSPEPHLWRHTTVPFKRERVEATVAARRLYNTRTGWLNPPPQRHGSYKKQQRKGKDLLPGIYVYKANCNTNCYQVEMCKKGVSLQGYNDYAIRHVCTQSSERS